VGLPEAQYALAQAATYIATAPKSNRAGQAYWAAAGDVAEHGSLPVPNHLRSAGDRRMTRHGIGVGYRYPHDFEGADVEQQYLPDELAGRRYYLPTDQGYEATIGERMNRRADARDTAKAAGKTPANPHAAPVIARGAGDRLLKSREASRKQLAETEKRDAEA
jgi:putative ATPase